MKLSKALIALALTTFGAIYPGHKKIINNIHVPIEVVFITEDGHDQSNVLDADSTSDVQYKDGNVKLISLVVHERNSNRSTKYENKDELEYHHTFYISEDPKTKDITIKPIHSSGEYLKPHVGT